MRVYLRYDRDRRGGEPVTVQDFRHQLEIVGFDFTDYRNPNASISGSLQKLVAAGEVEKVRIKRDGTSVYAYKPTDKLKEVQVLARVASNPTPMTSSKIAAMRKSLEGRKK
jgi:hypothetical protein